MQLVDDVEELEEHGGEAAVAGVPEVAPLVEPVTEGQPLLLYKSAETLQSPVVGVEAQLSYTGHLRRKYSIKDQDILLKPDR